MDAQDDRKDQKTKDKRSQRGIMDGPWIRERMELLGLTVRSLAKAAGYSSFSTMQKIIEGKRQVKLADIEPLAVGLQTTPLEILNRAGLGEIRNALAHGGHPLFAGEPPVRINSRETGVDAIPGGGGLGGWETSVAASWIDSELVFHEEEAAGAAGALGVAGGFVGGPGGSVVAIGRTRCAARFQTLGGPYGAFDGAILFFEKVGPGQMVSAEHFGRLCVVTVGGERKLRLVGRGAGATVTLFDPFGRVRERDVAVQNVAKVISIQFEL